MTMAVPFSLSHASTVVHVLVTQGQDVEGMLADTRRLPVKTPILAISGLLCSSILIQQEDILRVV